MACQSFNRICMVITGQFKLCCSHGSLRLVGCPAAGQRPVCGAAPEMNAAGESLISVTDSP